MLIAGGGTGGHLYPGVALAEEVTTRQAGNQVLFVGTERGIEARVVPELGSEIEFIDVAGLKGRGVFGALRALFSVPRSMFQSLRVVRKFSPDVAVGVGGYASGPVILAARMLGIPTAILEQNTVPGLTNRILGRIVERIFVTFEESESFFKKKRVMMLGNPIRRQLLDNFLQSKQPTSRFTVLVLGGSQGAHALNLRMVEAAGHLGDLEEKIHIIHQTGTADVELVRRGYAEIGFEAEVSPFIEDMSSAYRRTDLVVCRAGATTIAELLVSKKPAILVPYPFATDNHQELNARSVVRAGAAVMMVERQLDGMILAEKIRELRSDPDRLLRMEQAASRAGRPEAAREIVDVCAELIARRGGEK